MILRKFILVPALAGVCGLLGCANVGGSAMNDHAATVQTAGSIYDFTLNDIDGKPVALSQYRGQVLMLVNVASKCGFTPQYEGLQKLYDTYKDQGFVILGFPANNFLGQEPGTDFEIKSFCSLQYGVTFPVFAKISVKGKDKHPLYQFLTDKKTNPDFSGEINWNFSKFLIGRDGKILDRFAPITKPDSKSVIKAIETAVKN
jgi:glutathione peroxidase